jgi:hypothetical protein
MDAGKSGVGDAEARRIMEKVRRILEKGGW